MKANLTKSVFLMALLLPFILTPGHCGDQNQIVKIVTQTDIQQRIQSIKDKQNLPEELKARILSAYTESADNLKELQAQEAQAEAYKQSMLALPLEAKKMARQIADAENSQKNRKPENFVIFPTDELEQRLVTEKTQLSDLDAEISRIENQIVDQMNRPQLIREKISEIKNRQVASQQEQQSLALRPIENSQEREAVLTRLDTRIRLLNATLKALELENISDPLRLQAQNDRVRLLNLQHQQLGIQIADLDNFLLDRRQQEIDKEQAELKQAQKEAEGKDISIQDATRENIVYNRKLQEITKNMEMYLGQKNELEQHYKQLEKDFQNAEQKINLAGLSPALGNLLREQRRNLPQHKQYNTLNDNIQNEIAKTSLESFKLEESRKNLADISQAMLARMNQKPPNDTADSEKLKIRTELRMLLNDQKELVGRLAAVYAEYARVLGDVDFSLQQMLAIADKYSAYLDKRLLWVPSAPVIDKYYVKEIADSLFWLANPAGWLQVLLVFCQGIEKMPLLLLAGLTIIGLQWRFAAGIKTRLQNLSTQKTGIYHHLYSIGQTLEALAYNLLLSLTWPLLMAWVAIVLTLSGNNDLFSRAFAAGLFSAAQSLCVMQFFFRLFKADGVAETFFEWRQSNTILLFKQFKWARFVLVPCVFLTAMTGSDVFSEQSMALGRTALIIMMLAMTYLLHRLTHPLTGLGNGFNRESRDWTKWWPHICYVIALLLPLIIIGFAVAGYYQSALELKQKLVFTLRLIFITVLFHELAQRWLAYTQRQLAIQNAKQKRKQDSQSAAAALEAGLPVDESLLDISKIDKQSHKLLTAVIVLIVLLGFWMIWSDILAAFSVFDSVVLWQHAEILEGKESLKPVTLVNLMLALTYASFTFVIVSNFPALVDLLSVGKFEMTPGSRYALIHLIRYLFTGVAFLAIANELGGSWSQVQWLVAALSVGLGFGLQEIFANMVSGIILLFERPIRVGDTVTVGDVTGRVTRIQMRATHIVDWDRKELVVPNKTFITDRLINWTLSDTVTRLVVPVGVAYGSQIDEVEQVLNEAVKKTYSVLLEPPPKVLFQGFGESALNFNIHVFVNELTDRSVVRHTLHKNIYESLQAHGIDIPFPQYDVHIRSDERRQPTTGNANGQPLPNAIAITPSPE